MNMSDEAINNLFNRVNEIRADIRDDDWRTAYEQALEEIAPVKSLGISKVIYDFLEQALKQRSKRGIDFGTTLFYVYREDERINVSEFIPLLSAILADDFHYCHEDLARAFQAMKSPDTVDVLYETALKDEQRYYRYLDISEYHPLAVKCIWALGDIATDKAREKLVLLASSENEEIRKNAERQIRRIDGTEGGSVRGPMP